MECGLCGEKVNSEVFCLSFWENGEDIVLANSFKILNIKLVYY